jgi:hypothetical protein
MAGKMVKVIAIKARIYCRKCGSDRIYRIDRWGFLRNRIYSLFGFYPWKCKVCGRHMMLWRRTRART